MSTHQFANIAPAPQTNNAMQSGQGTMGVQPGAGGGQVMSPNGQPMQQFQLIPSQLGGNAQYGIPQIAAFNQQGQYVLQPANFAFQSMPGGQASGQQFTLIAAPQMQQQKPGQAMQNAQMQQGQQGKGLVPISMGQSAGYTFTGNMVNASGGTTPQTFIMANPMGGNPIMATQGGLMSAQMQAQLKQDAGKIGQGQQSQQQNQAQQQGQQQPIMMPQGVIMTSQGQPGQAIYQNGQIIFRSDGGQPQIMFQSPPHGMTAQGAQTQQLPPGMASNMQPLMQPPTQMRPASVVPSVPPPGKTPISRSLAPILPTTSTPGTWRQYSSVGSNSSPKSKSKVSPRGPGQVGRPPGSTKSALASLKATPPSSSSPPVLQPNSPHVHNTLLGPPVLQSLVPLDPARTSPNSMPPTLQPMLPSSGVQANKPNDSHPPVLMANGPVPSSDSPTKLKNSSFSNRKSEDSGDNHHYGLSNGDGHSSLQSSTPKAVVKPNVLTHVIDGHIIQESSQPFPLDGSEIKDRTSSFVDTPKSMNGSYISTTFSSTTSSSVISKPLTSQTTTTTTSFTSSSAPGTSLLLNRNIAPKPSQTNSPSVGDLKPKISSKSGENQPLSEKKRGPGRPPGSTKQNLEANKTAHINGDIKNKLSDIPPSKKSKLDISDNLKISTPMSPNSKPSMKSPSLNIDMSTNNPLKWTVTEVCNFVKSLPGCAEYVEDFQLQEIDGQALMLLKTEHLMTAMSIRLGPALKICSAVDAMREQLKQN